MSLNVSEVLPYGPLERIEVYFEHNGPRFFALRSRAMDVRLIAICVDEMEEQGEVVFLYLAMSPERFADVRSGKIGLKRAFEVAEPWTIWRVVESYGVDASTVSANAVRFADIPAADLPHDEARLELPTHTAPNLDVAELSDLACRSLRTFVAIELDASGENQTEFPLRGVGAIGESVQETIDALAQEAAGRATEFGPISAAITGDVQMSVYGLRAASFVLVLATDKRGGLFENSDRVLQALSRFAHLVDVGRDPSALVEVLRGSGARARNKFTDLLRAAVLYRSGFGLTIAPEDGPVSVAHLTRREAWAALEAIDAVEPVEERLRVERGILQGSNTRRATFEMVDLATMRRYSGRVSPDAQSAIDGLRVGRHSFVAAEILVQVAFGAGDQETGRTYTLLSVKALRDD